ncbi:MAG TPA: hypothetical protein PKY88_13115, partial [Anaerohalosphaeraceae bacterium]|nr:hypothetical protein [Anaerohalosphaeraceae bacterium]
MNNLIARVISVTPQYQPLASKRLVATITLSAPPANSQPVYLKGDSGQDVPLVPGEWHTFQRVNLAEIRIKGTAGDT